MAAQDNHFAISDLSGFGFQDEENPSGVNLQSYIYTDRPVYRPTHKVYFKGIVRDLQSDGYKLPKEAGDPLNAPGSTGTVA